jgi:hypothetical protein
MIPLHLLLPLLLVHKKVVLIKEEMLLLELKEIMLQQILNKIVVNKVELLLKLKEIILHHNRVALNKVETLLLQPKDLDKFLPKDLLKMDNPNIFIDNLIYFLNDCDIIGYYLILLFHCHLHRV